MKSCKLFYVILIAGLFICGCDKKSDSNQILSKDAPKIVQDNTAFAMDLYKQHRSSEGNLFFSPYSISTALAMTYAGARGDTQKQIAKALHFTLDQNDIHLEFAKLQERLNQIQEKGNIKLNIANSLWPQKDYPFLEKYLSLTKSHYGVSITPVDFVGAPLEAANTINKWVEDKTQGKIKDIISTLSPEMRLVLVNAIYFKGNWEHEFYPSAMKDMPFYMTAERSIQTPMMFKGMKTMYAETQDIQVLELSYIGQSVSMLVLLPKEINGLEKLESSLSIKNLDSWRKKLKEEQIIIYLPKFKMTCEYGLNPTFIKMGMVDAFKLPGADFSGMTGKNDLFISFIIHKAYVEVNEEGTEAAAATGVGGVSLRGAPQPKIFEFKADHPFLFLIQENQTGSILFMGRLINPAID